MQSVETLECRNICVIVSVLTTSEVDSVFEPSQVRPKTFTVSPPNTQHRGVRIKTVWFIIQIMCPIAVTDVLTL